MCQKSRSLNTQVVFCAVYGLAIYNSTLLRTVLWMKNWVRQIRFW